MADKKKSTKRRKAPKPGLGQLAVWVSVVSDATGGKLFKNAATDAIRIGYINQIQEILGMPGPTGAVIAGLVYEFGRVEINKMQKNPAFGPVRLF